MGIGDLKKLGQKDYKLYLFLVVWLLIALGSLKGFTALGFPLIGVIIVLPFLAFTLFLYFLSFKKKDLSESGPFRTLGYLIISLILMPLLFFAVLVLFVISIISYIVLTSMFTLYGCYRRGKEIDEKLYLKKRAWIVRGVEFWGGLAFSVILLLVLFFGSVITMIDDYGDTPIILVNIAYIAIIAVIIALAGLAIVSSITGRFNAWLGAYFIIVTIYTVYLVLKVIMGVQSGESGATSNFSTTLILIFVDLGILLYSIGGLIGTQAEVLNRRLKVRPETAFFWLIFSRAAWEFAVNFPYEYIEQAQGFLLTVIQIGSILNLITSIAILILFVLFVFLFGVYGILAYFSEKKELKKVKKDLKIAEESGERVDITMAIQETPKKKKKKKKEPEEMIDLNLSEAQDDE
ncbi:MAG: hypothetical protein ACTSR8_10985 [Promethearchaeota archaeon]